MTRKSKRIKFAKYIRRHCKMTLPESIKVAKFYYNWADSGYPQVPANVVERLEQDCLEGCCWRTNHYVMSREGKLVRLKELSQRFNHDEF